MPIKAGYPFSPRVKLGKAPDDCWKWLLAKSQDGHGKVTLHGNQEFAHRWLWMQLFGPIPPGYVIYHTCGSKECINPHHLAMGFQADANRHGINAKLLQSDVYEIRRAKEGAGPHTAVQLADRYGVDPATIYDIWRRTTWRKGRPNYGPNKSAATRPAAKKSGEER